MELLHFYELFALQKRAEFGARNLILFLIRTIRPFTKGKKCDIIELKTKGGR